MMTVFDGFDRNQCGQSILNLNQPMCFDSISTYASFSYYPLSSFGQRVNVAFKYLSKTHRRKLISEHQKRHDIRGHLTRAPMGGPKGPPCGFS